MKVLVACEESGVVREAFQKLGHEAYSCDLEPSSQPSNFHIQRDAIEVSYGFPWDLMIAHPPCTHLAVSGAKHFWRKEAEQKEALEFVQKLMNAPISKIAIENPVSVISTKIRKPDQIVQPWWFGDPFTKTTCLWLKNLPKLIPTNIVDKGERHTTKSGKRIQKWINLPPGPDRAKIRSRTFQGFADAMAQQWGQTV